MKIKLGTITWLWLIICLTALSSQVIAQEVKPETKVLFINAHIFNGESDKLTKSMSVLVEGNKIVKIANSIATSGVTKVIDADGRTLIPGLIDVHTHMMMSELSEGVLFSANNDYVTLVAGKAATGTLMRGFTSVRDLSGSTFGLKRAIDEGVLAGPRIWPSGPAISQTSGHGDFRSAAHDIPASYGRDPNWAERYYGYTRVADGRDQVLQATRENLMRGASQIKVMAGGGVASMYDPLDVTQYTEDEIRAAVEAAANWKTYVTVHAYTSAAIQQAIRAGVKCVEHGQLMDEATVKMAVKAGVWLSMQPFLDDEDAIPLPKKNYLFHRKKQLQMTRGTDRAYKLAKKHGAKIAWGTDTLFSHSVALKQGKMLAKMTRWFTPSEVLKMATHDNAQVLALSGPRNPYPGKLGVIKEGALADLILVDGNPLENIQLIVDPDQNFKVIMKDGRIYKNTLN